MVHVITTTHMRRGKVDTTCLFCGQQFNDLSDLFKHSGLEHVRTRDDY